MARRVAALTYKVRLHVINVFVWPEAGAADSAPRSELRQGYSVVRWTRRGMDYGAVSDAEAAQLAALAEALEHAEAGG